jgi:DNA-binding transcriptional MerR regulator
MEVDEEIRALRDEGKTYREICEILKVSPKQVRAALKREDHSPLALLEQKAELEERKAKAIRRIEKAREQLAEPGLVNRLTALELFVTQKFEELELRMAKIEKMVEHVDNKSSKTFREEIEDLIELQKLDYLAAETRKRLWGF